jgi:hypothetical protein
MELVQPLVARPRGPPLALFALLSVQQAARPVSGPAFTKDGGPGLAD